MVSLACTAKLLHGGAVPGLRAIGGRDARLGIVCSPRRCGRSERCYPAGFEQQPADGTEFGGLVGLQELSSRGRLHGAARATYWGPLPIRERRRPHPMVGLERRSVW